MELLLDGGRTRIPERLEAGEAVSGDGARPRLTLDTGFFLLFSAANTALGDRFPTLPLRLDDFTPNPRRLLAASIRSFRFLAYSFGSYALMLPLPGLLPREPRDP